MNQTSLKRLTITLPESLMDRLAQMRTAHRVSVSAIVEHMIESHLATTSEETMIERLQQRGASLRRSRPNS